MKFTTKVLEDGTKITRDCHNRVTAINDIQVLTVPGIAKNYITSLVITEEGEVIYIDSKVVTDDAVFYSENLYLTSDKATLEEMHRRMCRYFKQMETFSLFDMLSAHTEETLYEYKDIFDAYFAPVCTQKAVYSFDADKKVWVRTENGTVTRFAFARRKDFQTWVEMEGGEV